MREISTKQSGVLLPLERTPLIVPNFAQGSWSATQTGNIISISTNAATFTAGIDNTGKMTVTSIGSNPILIGHNIIFDNSRIWNTVTDFIIGTNGGVGIYQLAWFKNNYNVASVDTVAKTITVKEAMVSGTTIGWTITRANINYTVASVDTVAKTITLSQSMVGTDAIGWVVYQQEVTIPSGTALTSGFAHNMLSDPASMISNTGNKVYLSFTNANIYFSDGWYDNIIITSYITFTCTASNTVSTQTPNISIKPMTISLPLMPISVPIPKDTITIGSVVTIEADIFFGKDEVTCNALIGTLSQENVFYANDVGGGTSGFHLYNTIKFLGDSSHVSNRIGPYAHSRMDDFYGSINRLGFNILYLGDYNLKEGFSLIPYVGFKNTSITNNYQMWTSIRARYVR